MKHNGLLWHVDSRLSPTRMDEEAFRDCLRSYPSTHAVARREHLDKKEVAPDEPGMGESVVSPGSSFSQRISSGTARRAWPSGEEIVASDEPGMGESAVSVGPPTAKCPASTSQSEMPRIGGETFGTASACDVHPATTLASR